MGSSLKGVLRSATGQLLLRTGMHRRWLQNVAVITAFHRITDQSVLDAITIRQHEFDTFCRRVGRHFNVISLHGLLDRLRKGQDISGCMVITFDDGYEDNRTIAAEVLKHYGLPATFFIATDLIGSDTQPYWDKANGVHTRWMSWEQVRELHAMGFEIGAHTRTHADLASLPEREAYDEILGSRRALEEALGAEVRLFSFPFGGAHQCTDQVRKLVADAGLICCPSCHGGLVRPGDDPFHLKRVPVNRWYADYWHLGAEILNDSRLGN
jgi:peptidoglycan/xylan/chitin deacetylase (PgdA/CDA1 family)